MTKELIDEILRDIGLEKMLPEKDFDEHHNTNHPE